MNRQDIIAAILSLDLPITEYVVVGGAAMAVRDLRDTDDVDVVVTPELFDRLARSGWNRKTRPNGKPGLRQGVFEAYLDVNTDGFKRETSWLVNHAEVIQGIPCVDLATLAAWKRSYGRDKDLRDVAMLETLENRTRSGERNS